MGKYAHLPWPMPTADLRHLSSTRALLRFALPFAAGAGLGYFMHFANRMFLSWYSTDALAAALPAGFLAWTVQGLFITAAGYVGTFAGTHHGADEPEEAGAMLWPMLVLCGLAAVVSLALIPARHLIVGIYGAEPNIAAPMAELFAWYMAETGLIALASGIGGFFAGVGRPILVLVMAVAGCALAIPLNHILILGDFGLPAQGIRGAGLATLATSAVVAAVWLTLLFGPHMRRTFGVWRQRNLDPRRLWRFAYNALPRGGCEVLEMIGFLMFNAAVTRLGTDTLAAHNLVFSVYLLVMVPLIGLCNGLTVAVGQAIGAGRVDLARTVMGKALRILLGYLAVAAVLFLGFPQLVLAPYQVPDPERWQAILAISGPLLIFSVASMLPDGLQWVFRCTVQGAGDTRWPFAMLTSAAFLLCGLPALGVGMLVEAHHWPSWAPRPLYACWTIFVVYCWAIALIMFARYRWGPWSRMSLRE